MDKQIKLKVSHPSHTTQIHFGIDFALSKHIPRMLDETDRKVALITDTQIEKRYGPVLEKLDLKVFSFPEGEAQKNRKTKEMLEDHLLSHQFGRDSLLIGLGGGVVTDLTGFLASNYCRGVPVIFVPTTLLGMVDAAIGGKTGINTPFGKNMIGSFYPPEEVIIDGSFLSTLPKHEWTNGVVELLKAALIASPSLFESMNSQIDLWNAQDLPFIMDQIFEGIQIKKEVVERDPFEKRGERRILNFGHTIGHAIEQFEEYKIPHGQAVAIGILAACYISEKMGLLGSNTRLNIEKAFRLFHIPLEITKEISFDALVKALSIDKKSQGSIPRMVLIEGIGRVAAFNGEYCTQVDFSLIDETLIWIHKNFLKSHG